MSDLLRNSFKKWTLLLLHYLYLSCLLWPLLLGTLNTPSYLCNTQTCSFLIPASILHFLQNPHSNLHPFSVSHSPMAASSQNPSNFHDFLPTMAEKLGGDGLIGELCNGFNLLTDGDKGVITFESLKRNSALLGLQDLSDEDLRSMLREGDFDGDGALNQMEFCVLMFRLSPELMEESEFLLEEALQQEFEGSY